MHPRSRPPEPLLPSESLVEQTMREAQRMLALALGGAALLISSLMATGFALGEARNRAAERLAEATRITGELRLLHQSLGHLAQMAVISGGDHHHHAEAYYAEEPRLERALQAALTLAPPELVAAFDERAHEAAKQLIDMREAAFGAMAVHAWDSARAILGSPRYEDYDARLDAAVDQFAAATVAAAEEEVSRLEARMAIAGGATLALGGLLGLALWRRLSRRLADSREHFLRAEDRIQSLAASDLLTGMPNRTALHDAMAAALARATRQGHALALLMIDLDRFKPVNDRHGHAVGDKVLQEVAARLHRCLRGGELQARYGGDEFVVAIELQESAGHAARSIAERIVHALGEPMAIDGLAISIGASVGVACFPADAQDDDELLRRADSALYRAKSGGRGRVCFYDAKLDAQVAERTLLEQAMREGIARGEFVPHYQPIVALATRAVQGIELLCRWQHPQRGLLPPAEFIPLAEETGLVGPMTMAVLARACADLARLPAHWQLSINLAPQQLLDDTLVPQLLHVLQEGGVSPQRLDVELTESALVVDSERAAATMRALKEAGISVTLDDFGTGVCSLQGLAEISFDRIKIDRSFVRTLHERPSSARIVEAVVGLSRSLGAQVLAEGVETERDAAALRALGCTLAQGWLFGRPVPAAELQASPAVATA